MRRQACLGVLFCLVILIGCGGEGESDRQRIYLITVDTFRADHLGLLGYPRQTSPFLDSLADESLVFTNAFSSASTTAPSHASLFTGLQPPQHRLLANGRKLKGSLLTLPEALGDAGFVTAAFTPTGFLESLAQGVDHFWSPEDYVPATRVLDEAADWLDRQRDEERVFVWIHLFDLHEWKKDDRLHRKEHAWATKDSAERFEELAEHLREDQGIDLEGSVGDRQVADVIDRYDAQIRAVDAALADFYAREQAQGDGPSIWVVTADHGEAVGSHDFLFHGEFIYQEQLRVPLVLHFPDQPDKRGRIDSLVRLVDLGPSLAELGGTSLEEQIVPLTGQSFVPALVEGGEEWREPDVFALRRPANERRLGLGWVPGDVFSLRRDSWKIIVETEGQTRLFDLSEDPLELEDVSEQQPELTLRMGKAVTARFIDLWRAGDAVGARDQLAPEYIEELEALGYL